MYGRHVFMGYLNNEDKTKEAIDDEGWLHSGDLGKIDKDGFLSITGRIKGDHLFLFRNKDLLLTVHEIYNSFSLIVCGCSFYLCPPNFQN